MNSGFDWEQRYAASTDLFGQIPSELLVAHRHLLSAGQTALAVGDGEGRNAIWLAEQGLDVLAIDISTTALSRAEQRAQQRGVMLHTRCVDALDWDWPLQHFDIITSIFVHLPAMQRQRLHRLMFEALKPGGLVFIEGFHRDQAHLDSGGPSNPDLLFTPEILLEDFPDADIVHSQKAPTQVVMDGNTRGAGIAYHFIARRP